MTYDEMLKVTRKGKLGKLPNFIGYFKWNFVENDMIFYNGDFQCKASDLDILNRTDFYYIT